MAIVWGMAAAGRQCLRGERIVLRPAERREAVLRVIRAVEKRLVISFFRCDDFEVLDELAKALARRVRVQALLTRRAKGWRKRLDKLGTLLEEMGAEVHRYSGPRLKYHAKYVVADDGPALIASSSFTRKCFGRTCDFLLTCDHADIVAGLKGLFDADWHAPSAHRLPPDRSQRLIVAPERARARLTALIRQARHSIRIIDPKVTDPAIVRLLRARQAAGVAVQGSTTCNVSLREPHLERRIEKWPTSKSTSSRRSTAVSPIRRI